MPIKTLLLSLAFAAGLSSLQLHAQGQLLQIESETFDGKDFTLPADLAGSKLNVLFLAMGKDQKNGQLQQDQLLAWQEAIDGSGGVPDGVVCYHFPIVENPPRLVRGIIRKAMRKSYEDKVPLNQAGVFYIDDMQAFASAGGLNPDAEPTIVIVTPKGQVLHQIKGAVSDDKLTELRQTIDTLLKQNS